MRATVQTFLTALVGCIGVFALDQYTKQLFFDANRSFFFVLGWIQSIHHQNYGIAFNLPIPQWLILGITLIACVGVISFLIRKRTSGSLLLALSLGVLLGGALGNAFDRIFFGFVRDWFLLWFRSAINIADLGVLLGLVGAFFFSHRASQNKT